MVKPFFCICERSKQANTSTMIRYFIVALNTSATSRFQNHIALLMVEFIDSYNFFVAGCFVDWFAGLTGHLWILSICLCASCLIFELVHWNGIWIDLIKLEKATQWKAKSFSWNTEIDKGFILRLSITLCVPSGGKTSLDEKRQFLITQLILWI